MSLFGRLPRVWPGWYRSTTRQADVRVGEGRHPMGCGLGPEDSRCRDCEHLRRQDAAVIVWRCWLVGRAGHGSRVRRYWRGCERFGLRRVLPLDG